MTKLTFKIHNHIQMILKHILFCKHKKAREVVRQPKRQQARQRKSKPDRRMVRHTKRQPATQTDSKLYRRTARDTKRHTGRGVFRHTKDLQAYRQTES